LVRSDKKHPNLQERKVSGAFCDKEAEFVFAV